MLTCLEGLQSCYVRCSATTRCVYIARRFSPARSSVCTTPDQTNGNFSRASARACEANLFHVYRPADCRSHRMRTGHRFLTNSPSPEGLQQEFSPLHSTAGFSLAFSLCYAAWGRLNKQMFHYSCFYKGENDDLFNCKSYFYRPFTYRFDLLQLLLSILESARLRAEHKRKDQILLSASWKIYQSGGSARLVLFLAVRNFNAPL